MEAPQQQEEGRSLVERPGQAAQEDGSTVSSKGCHNSDVRKAYRNVYGLSLSLFFLFSAFQSVQNLQSSVNARGGLGVISLSLLYTAFMLSGIVTTSIVKVLGTKYAVMGAMVCHLIYVLCNFRGTWYSLVPASLLIGFASGPLWAASSAHITQIAVKLAPVIRERQDLLISQFTGVIFLFTQVSNLPGNLASSLILLHASDRTNESQIVNTECRNSTISADSGQIKDTYWYVLVSVFVLFDIVGIVILALLVDRLPSTDPFCSNKAKFKHFFVYPSLSTITMAFKWRLVFLGFMFVCSGLVQSFAYSVFAKVRYCSLHELISYVKFVLLKHCRNMFQIALVSVKSALS